MKAQSQLTTAETFGIIAYEQNKMFAPAQCSSLMNMLKGRKIGETPKNEASSLELMESWKKGYNKAKRIYMKSKFGF